VASGQLFRNINGAIGANVVVEETVTGESECRKMDSKCKGNVEKAIT
jgi:hypothetical protein